MGVFDPTAEVGGGEVKPGWKHLKVVSADVHFCKSGREAINFKFSYDGTKTMYNDVTLNSIFSSVIKGMMIGVGLNPERFANAELQDIAFAFNGKEGEAFCKINDRGYLSPAYWKDEAQEQKAPTIGKATGSYKNDEPPIDNYERQAGNPDFQDDETF